MTALRGLARGLLRLTGPGRAAGVSPPAFPAGATWLTTPADPAFAERSSPATPATAGGLIGTRGATAGPTLTAPADAARPLAAAVPGGLAGVFDGVSTTLAGGGLGGGLATSLTVFARLRIDATTADRHLIDLSFSFLVFTFSTDAGRYGWYDGAWRSSAVSPVAGPATVVWQPSAGGVIRVNGVQVASGLPYAPGGRLLEGTWLGANHGGGNAAPAAVSAVGAYLRDLSGAEVLALEAALDAIALPT